MKKLLLYALVFVALLSCAAWYMYHRMIPEIVGKAIVQGTEPVVLPKVYKEKIKKIKKPVNRVSEKLIEEADSLHVPFSAILRLIDQTDNKDVVKTIEELKAAKPTSPAEVFDIVQRNIPSPDFDFELFREPFLKYATMDKYAVGMRYIENNRVVEQIDEMPYREIIKEVLTQKRAEIDHKLKHSGGPKLR